MSHKEFMKEEKKYFSKLNPTDEDFKKYTSAYFTWSTAAMARASRPVDIREKIMV